MVVSVEPAHGTEIPDIHREDVRVLQGRERLQVNEWTPLEGDHASLELLILINEATDAGVSNQFDDLRNFLNSQPATTKVAVGYMEYGTVRMAQNFTDDHAAAGKALRIPQGVWAGGSSPFLSISDAIKKWPSSPARHIILLISDGVDPMQPGIQDSYLDGAINLAQRTGTQIYAIYASPAGHFGHTLWRINQGQNNLSRLADETGGESYFQGYGMPVSFTPYLDRFAFRLMHQFKLVFLAKPRSKPGLQGVRLETEVPNAELVGADAVYVPAAK
ncbi:MAG: hypothetical protein ACRD4Y_17415 [Candidatus Acidiferrales bacterium]